MNIIKVVFVVSFVIFESNPACCCAFPSLQGAFRNDQTIFIAEIKKENKKGE